MWKGVWISVISTALIGGATWAWQKTSEYLQRASSQFQNLPDAEAFAAAKATIGAHAVDAIPFRNSGSEVQYIAVFVLDRDTLASLAPPGSVWLLVGTNGVFQVQRPPFGDVYFQAKNADDLQKYARSVYGVVDIDGDGKKEIFAIYHDRGTSVANYILKVFDPTTGEMYQAEVASSYADTVINPQVSDNIDKKNGLRGWMNERLRELVFAGSSKGAGPRTGQSAEVDGWYRKNGRGFLDGTLQLVEVAGRTRKDEWSSVVCTVEDGAVVWESYFKGPLVMYDKRRDAHAVVFVPTPSIREVETLVVGVQYVWLGVESRRGLVVFEKKANRIRVIPVEEWKVKETGSDAFQHLGRVEKLRLAKGRLHAGETPLTLQGVDQVEEFATAAECRERVASSGEKTGFGSSREPAPIR